MFDMYEQSEFIKQPFADSFLLIGRASFWILFLRKEKVLKKSLTRFFFLLRFSYVLKC